MEKLGGAALVALSAVSFGLMPIFVRFAYADGAGVLTLLSLRFALGALFLIILMKLRRLPFPRGRTLAALVLMGAAGYTGQSFCYFTALKYASASLVSLLLYLYPALVSALSAIFLREKISVPKAAALVFALAGSALIVGFGGAGDMRGIALALGAAVIYSLYIVCGSRVIGAGQAVQSSAVIMLSAAMVFGILAAFSGFDPPDSALGMGFILAIALVSTVFALVAFFAGMERVGPTSASMISTLEPMVTVAAAAIFLGERVTAVNLAGGALIIAALVILAGPRIPKATGNR